MIKVIIGIVAIALLLFSGFWGVSGLIYLALSSVQPQCKAQDNEHRNTPARFTKEGKDLAPYYMEDYEDVRIPSRDAGITLAAWFIPAQGVDNPTDIPTVIVVHGKNDCRRHPQSLMAAGMLTRNGFNALVIDQRDHGDSTIEDGFMAAGVEEHRDVLGAWDWLVEEKGIAAEKIGLFGYSMGAGSVMIASSEEPRVAAIWEDSGWGDTNSLILDELSRNMLPGFFAGSACLMGKLITGDDITALSPLEAMSKLDGRPIFIVHGDADERVGVRYAFDLAEAATANGSPVEPWIVAGATHNEAMFEATEAYEQHLVAFFSEHLGRE